MCYITSLMLNQHVLISAYVFDLTSLGTVCCKTLYILPPFRNIGPPRIQGRILINNLNNKKWVMSSKVCHWIHFKDVSNNICLLSYDLYFIGQSFSSKYEVIFFAGMWSGLPYKNGGSIQDVWCCPMFKWSQQICTTLIWSDKPDWATQPLKP
jgi:hypothetical protein